MQSSLQGKKEDWWLHGDGRKGDVDLSRGMRKFGGLWGFFFIPTRLMLFWLYAYDTTQWTARFKYVRSLGVICTSMKVWEKQHSERWKQCVPVFADAKKPLGLWKVRSPVVALSLHEHQLNCASNKAYQECSCSGKLGNSSVKRAVADKEPSPSSSEAKWNRHHPQPCGNESLISCGFTQVPDP